MQGCVLGILGARSGPAAPRRRAAPVSPLLPTMFGIGLRWNTGCLYFPRHFKKWHLLGSEMETT